MGSVSERSFLLSDSDAFLLACVDFDLVFFRASGPAPTNGMDSYRSYILPVTVISVSYVGIYFRNVRSSMLNHLHEDYVVYGRACGLPEKKITMRILRNSLQVAVSIFCMAIPIILARPSLSKMCLHGPTRAAEREIHSKQGLSGHPGVCSYSGCSLRVI